MTPDDVAAIRAASKAGAYGYAYEAVGALCDALEAAWAACARVNGDMEAYCRYAREVGERAERAEAERDNAEERWSAVIVRAERAEQAHEMTTTSERKLARALARVRAVIDARPLYGTAYSLSERVRAAIEGDNQ